MTNRNYSATAQATTTTGSINNSATTLPVSATTGFPAAPFLLCLEAGTINQELVLVTAVSGLNLTVTRGYDSTSAVAHNTGAAVTHTHSAIDFRDSRTHENATTGVHGLSGAPLGTTDTQTVTNKNLTSGTNTFPTSLVTLTGTQALTNKDLTSGTNTFPTSLATLTGTQALANKDLTSGTNTFPASLATAANLTAHTGSASGVHGVTGSVVGTSDTQTLTNKTFDSTSNVPITSTKQGKRQHWAVVTSGSSDGSGFATVTHGGGFTPTVVVSCRGSALGSLYRVDQNDSYTSTTFRVRVLDGSGSAVSGVTVPVSFFMGE